MFLFNGTPLPMDMPFEADGTKYPANWLRLASPEEREAIGVTEIEEQQRPDDRYYWVTDNGDGTYTATPKDLDGLKAAVITQIKATAGAMLAATDWKIVRAAEGGKPCDPDTLAARAAIRKLSDANEASVVACKTVEELAAFVPVWSASAEQDVPQEGAN
jgi:hypothetical protein